MKFSFLRCFKAMVGGRSVLARTGAGALLLVATSAVLLAQGVLVPPGPPAPSMKTLQQIEPRVPIETVPFVITNSGSYYLTTNLNGAGVNNGIVIQASGVTIDLRGFSVANCVVGISAGSIKGVSIHNGTVRGSIGTGVDLSQASKVRLEGLLVCDNGGNGAIVGGGSIVTLCTAAGNGGQGLVLGNGGTVFHSVAQSNTSHGIVVSSNCRVSDNTCEGNGFGMGQAGIFVAGSGNRLEGNASNQNRDIGYLVVGTNNLVVRNNACGNAGGDFNVGAGNNYGQVLLSPGSAFVTANAWANFGCGTTPTACMTAAQCDDANPCTSDACIMNTCVNTAIPDCTQAACGNGMVEMGEQCDDGNLMSGDGCSATCRTECMTAMQCDDANPCTTDTCVMNLCMNTPISGCNEAVCGNGMVEAGEQCDDGNLMNGDGCNFNCVTECMTAMQCNDGDPCTTNYCMGGLCGHTPIANCGTPACGNGVVEAGEQCDDGNTMSGDTCSATCQIECTNSMQCEDGNPCTTNSCQSGVCVSVNASGGTCNDGNPCTTGDTCSNGTCVGSAKNCSDGNVCTTDTCDPMTGACVNTNNNASCNDGNPCTTGDTCNGGICQPGMPTVCNDNNPCTIDTCNPMSGCIFTPAPNNLPCDDGSVCTTGDMCQNGSCVGTAVTCPEDMNACTTAVCDPMSGCGFVNNTNPCDDGNLCTINDRCSASTGICAGTVRSCTDNNVCTTDTCEPMTGQCVHVNNTAACNDGNACTTGDVCSNGVCQGGAAVVCNDSNPCTSDSCNPTTGCVFTNQNGAMCSDGNACTTGDQCVNGVCAGTPTCPDDGNPCTTSSCNPMTGTCTQVNNTAACDDGNPCTSGDVCGNGVCSGTPIPNCTNVCGNGIVEMGEACDDANTINGDGCTATCTVQPGYQCVGSPSVCVGIP